jgi:hypothetical protein
MRKTRSLSLLGAALMIAGPLALGADAAASVNANGNVNQNVDWTLSWSCNNKSAQLNAGGVKHVGLGRLHAHFRGSNGNTAEADMDASIDVAVQGTYTTPKSPNDMGAGGNPYIWFQPNGSDNSILLGRCNEASSKQLIKKATLKNLVALSSLANVGASGCSNSTGPNITVGKSDKGSTRGRVWFSNQNSVDPAHRTAGTDAYGDFGMDMAAQVSKGGANGGVTGNPYIKFAFGVDLNGDKKVGQLSADEATAFGVGGEYYLADGTWTNDLSKAYGAERRCTDFGK